MRVQLVCAPEGAPNSSFAVYGPKRQELAFIQSDWDYAALAQTFGWRPCKKCWATDGTVACAHRTVSEMLAEAYDYLAARDGRYFNNKSEEYFSECPT